MSLGGLIMIALFVRDLSLQPIASLTITAQQMSMGNFTNLEFPENPQELKELSDALQSMANDLGAQIDALTSERPNFGRPEPNDGWRDHRGR